MLFATFEIEIDVVAGGTTTSHTGTPDISSELIRFLLLPFVETENGASFSAETAHIEMLHKRVSTSISAMIFFSTFMFPYKISGDRKTPAATTLP